MATVLAIIATAVLPLLTPWFVHPALDAAGSVDRLGLTQAQVHALSDRSVEQLLFGPGDFLIEDADGEPFYDADERSHLRDARVLLGVLLVAGGVSLLGLAFALVRWRDHRRSIWRLIGRAGLATAVVVVLVGAVALVAFDSLFSLFHQVFFPGGNWSFDPATQRMVQLYPFAFWQIAAAALGLLVFLLGLATWLLGRTQSTRAPAQPTSAATSG